MSGEQLYAWYSQKHHAFGGDECLMTYESLNGEERIICTKVIKSNINPGSYNWSDAKCVGPVGKHISGPVYATTEKDICDFIWE